MTLTVNVSEELESKIEEEASRNGLSSDEFVRIFLEEKLSAPSQRPNFPPRIIATDLPIRDFSLQHQWLEKHRDEYDGQYVALDGDKLIAASESGKALAIKLRELGVKDTFITFVEGGSQPPFISGGLWRE